MTLSFYLTSLVVVAVLPTSTYIILTCLNIHRQEECKNVCKYLANIKCSHVKFSMKVMALLTINILRRIIGDGFDDRSN